MSDTELDSTKHFNKRRDTARLDAVAVLGKNHG
jgi:hypothetical protein